MSRKGDWGCPKCSYNNFASRTKCAKCDYINKSANVKKDDWNCSCGEMNFATRTICRKCGKNNDGHQNWLSQVSRIFFQDGSVKESMNTSSISSKPGDWICSCKTTNFATRTVCRKCGKNNDTTTISNDTVKFKPGDWICPCKTINFGVRTVCYNCGTQKETTDSELCIICMERIIDTVIIKCGHLGYCGLCALNMNKCPLCRIDYSPDIDLLKVFKM